MTAASRPAISSATASTSAAAMISLALYTELFPLAQHVLVYDAPQGRRAKARQCRRRLLRLPVLESLPRACARPCRGPRQLDPGSSSPAAISSSAFPTRTLYEQGRLALDLQHRPQADLHAVQGENPGRRSRSNVFALLAHFCDKGEAAERDHHRSRLPPSACPASIRLGRRCRNAPSSSC